MNLRFDPVSHLPVGRRISSRTVGRKLSRAHTHEECAERVTPIQFSRAEAASPFPGSRFPGLQSVVSFSSAAQELFLLASPWTRKFIRVRFRPEPRWGATI